MTRICRLRLKNGLLMSCSCRKAHTNSPKISCRQLADLPRKQRGPGCEKGCHCYALWRAITPLLVYDRADIVNRCGDEWQLRQI